MPPHYREIVFSVFSMPRIGDLVQPLTRCLPILGAFRLPPSFSSATTFFSLVSHLVSALLFLRATRHLYYQFYSSQHFSLGSVYPLTSLHSDTTLRRVYSWSADHFRGILVRLLYPPVPLPRPYRQRVTVKACHILLLPQNVSSDTPSSVSGA